MGIIRYLWRMKVAAVIPARYGSTRLPGKPLRLIKGKPLIQYVYERVSLSKIPLVIVATDDARIATTVEGFGGKAIFTSPHHRSGTERVAEVAQKLDTDIVVNCQGDEPLIPPEAIQASIEPFRDPAILATTLITPLRSKEDLVSPHVVKAVVDKDGFALYFSRSPLPYPRDLLEKRGGEITTLSADDLTGFWQHIGLYAYRRDFLLKIATLPPTPLEKMEKLEQLRILENGYRIKTVITATPSIGVDTEEDLDRLSALL